MRKFLLASVAFGVLAALPGAAFADAMMSSGNGIDWSGIYLGIRGGGTFGTVDVNERGSSYNGPPPFSHSTRGLNAAVQGGYNWQFDDFVVGAEGELGYFGMNGDRQYPPYIGVRLPSDSRASSDGGVFATLTGRAGIVWDDNWLFFVKGGFAAADLTVHYIDDDPVGLILVSGTQKRAFQTGYTGGGGVEFMLPSGHTSVRLEYDYYDFGNIAHTATDQFGGRWTFNHDITSQSFTASVTFHW